MRTLLVLFILPICIGLIGGYLINHVSSTLGVAFILIALIILIFTQIKDEIK
jgi:uncharacterized membrane protein